MPQALIQHRSTKIFEEKNQWHVWRNSSDQFDAATTTTTTLGFKLSKRFNAKLRSNLIYIACKLPTVGFSNVISIILLYYIWST